MAIPRRTFLQGVGVTMALPWMESLAGFGSTEAMAATARAKTIAPAPKRFAVVFQGNGVNPNTWSAKGSGATMELSQTLQPLEPLKHKINVIDGLFNKAATGVGIHPGMTGNLLTGVPLQKGAIIHSGVSMDQVIAGHVGKDTTQSSLVLAIEEPMTRYHETNFSNAHGRHLVGERRVAAAERDVSIARVRQPFREPRNMRNVSILDRVRARRETAPPGQFH